MTDLQASSSVTGMDWLNRATSVVRTSSDSLDADKHSISVANDYYLQPFSSSYNCNVSTLASSDVAVAAADDSSNTSNASSITTMTTTTTEQQNAATAQKPSTCTSLDDTSSITTGTSSDGKPPYSYATLIRYAIQSSPDKKLTLSQIYQWVLERYPYYNAAGAGWKVCVSQRRRKMAHDQCTFLCANLLISFLELHTPQSFTQQKLCSCASAG